MHYKTSLLNFYSKKKIHEKKDACLKRSFSKTKPELDIELRENEQGKKFLHFPFLAVSDTHLGTRHSRAKRLSHMLEHISSDITKAIGDVVDLEYMSKKSSWNFAPWHRQALAHLIRKQAQYFTGNHDRALRGSEILHDGKYLSHRKWINKKIFGVSIVNEDIYTDPKGRIFKIKHGDDFDAVAFGNNKKFWYRLGDLLHAPIVNFDVLIRKTKGLESFSTAAPAKKIVKVIVNTGFGVEKEIMNLIDADKNIDGLLYGHSHSGGFKRTPLGKLLINAGCTTDNVQGVVHDHKGVWALITWHKNRMDIEEENGNKRTVSWKQLGLSSFSNPPTFFEDIHTWQADRALRVFYRLAPPRDRQEIIKQRREAFIAGRVPPPIPDHICVPDHSYHEAKAPLIASAQPAQPHRPQQAGRNKTQQPVTTSLAFANNP